MRNLEIDTREKYSDSSVYSPGKITISLFQTGQTFACLQFEEKTKLLLQCVSDKRVLDLGCANGQHLSEIAGQIKSGIGVDFSIPFIQFAASQYRDRPNLSFVVGDARSIPLSSKSIDVAYSFATLYHVDDIDSVFGELARVLADGGVAILELGNAHSFATLVSRQYSDIARHSSRTISEHLRSLRRKGFKIQLWRSFQILPMWGDRPRWLQLLRSPLLENLATRRYRDRMLDEWISSLPGIRRFAFRHLVVAVKG